MCDHTHTQKKYTRVHRNCESGLARSNIITSIKGELSDTIMRQKERKEVKHIKSKNRTVMTESGLQFYCIGSPSDEVRVIFTSHLGQW